LKTVLKVALGIVLGATVLIGGCVALIGAGVDEANDEQKKKGITAREFRSVPLDSSRAEVRQRLGRPENAQAFEQAGIDGLTEPSRSSCIYYPEKGKDILEGRTFQLCFTNGRLDSKNIY
jgi:hypothetical protein